MSCGGSGMPTLLSPNQFVAGVMAALALTSKQDFNLSGTDVDERFEKAFERLMARSDEFAVVPSFSFARDSSHGDSATLRDTLLSARERKIIALNNPTFWTFEVKLSPERALRYLERNPIPREFYEEMANDLFAA
jgi:hypothetical protein